MTNITPIGGVLNRLEDQYTSIDLLPESLLPAVVTHLGGDLESRCHGVANLRNSLLQGEIPLSPCPWMPEHAQSYISKNLEQSGVVRFCQQSEEVTDALILDVLMVLDRAQQRLPLIAGRLAEEQYQHELLLLKQELEEKHPQSENRPKLGLSQSRLSEIRSDAEGQAWLRLLSGFEGDSITGGLLSEVWIERLQVWQKLETVFTDLGLVANLGFDLSRGILQSHGWMNLVRLHEVVKTLPQLRDVIQTLGRMKDADGPLIIEEIVTLMSVSMRHKTEVITPLVPMETKGITRSGSISRMLPQEAALLGHPILKKLFHAKRAEHALLSYAVQGTEILIEEGEELRESKEDRAGCKADKDRGPMIVCLDTSGSMKGTPENIAKALVLECLSVAVKEKRACYVYLFGSRDEVEELELTPTEVGLERIITFLSMSFGGGTEAEGPLSLAIERSDKDLWKMADILVVSDGEFPISRGLVRKINTRKKDRSLSVHGVLIGNQSSAMSKICDPLHRFSKWLDLQLNNREPFH